MKLKQNGFKTVSKQFCFSFISMSGQFNWVRARPLRDGSRGRFALWCTREFFRRKLRWRCSTGSSSPSPFGTVSDRSSRDTASPSLSRPATSLSGRCCTASTFPGWTHCTARTPNTGGDGDVILSAVVTAATLEARSNRVLFYQINFLEHCF